MKIAKKNSENSKENSVQKTASNNFDFYFAETATLISALPTHYKLLNETVSVSDIVIGEGIFVRVKVGHLNSLDVQCAEKEGKGKLYL